MKKENYNGWTNYETWRTALEFFDGFDHNDLIQREPEETEEDFTYRLSCVLNEYINEYQEQQNADDFYQSVIHLFFMEVNFYEIAENMLSK